MKYRLTDYTFYPIAKKIIFTGKFALNLDGFLIITNTTTGTLIYNFANSSLIGTLSGNTLTLTYDTSSMSAADKLQIWYEDGTLESDQPILNKLDELTIIGNKLVNGFILLLNTVDTRNKGYDIDDLGE